MTGVLDVSLITGALPLLISVAGGSAMLLLLLARVAPRWWRRLVPVAVLGSAAVTALLAFAVDEVWRPFPDPLPVRVLAWTGFALLGGVLSVVAGCRAHGWRRALAVPALVLVLALPAMKVNAFYGYYPTPRDALGLPAPNAVDLADLPPAELEVDPGGAAAESQVWTPPADMPDAGRVARVDIPGVVSGFRARPASVYLPPAYLSAQRRPRLPVLVLIPGQPGGPQDWLTAGRLAHVLDAFAAAHAGLVPVVVLPDATGSTLANPMCLDSRLGAVATYLTRDVPAWVRTTLQVDPDTRHWAVGGFSYGGTCALQLAVDAPQTYPTFLDISGQTEPTLGSRAQTVAAAFGGDEERFREVNPLDVLATRHFPGSAGVIAVGAEDHVYGPGERTVLAATRAAGMATRLTELPGGHSWAVATTALTGSLSWIAGRGGLTPATG